VHHVGILYDQFMMHGQRNIKLYSILSCVYICSPVADGI